MTFMPRHGRNKQFGLIYVQQPGGYREGVMVTRLWWLTLEAHTAKRRMHEQYRAKKRGHK